MSDTSSLLDDWTEEKCLQLINAFKRRPVLWDKNDIDYYRKDKKSSAWEGIAKDMNLTADACRHKMGILMSSFRREKCRLVNSMKCGDESKIYQSLWFAWPYLVFLLDGTYQKHIKCKANTDGDDVHGTAVKIISNEDHKNEEAGENSSNERIPRPVLFNENVQIIVNDNHEHEEENKSLEECISHFVLSKRNAKVLNEESQSNVPIKQARISVAPTTSDGPSRQPLPIPFPSDTSVDEITFFSTFIASKMKKYNEFTKNAVQQAICEIIFKADKSMHNLKYEPQCDPFEDEPREEVEAEENEELIKPQHIKIFYSDSE